jgi:hypothetical protein
MGQLKDHPAGISLMWRMVLLLAVVALFVALGDGVLWLVWCLVVCAVALCILALLLLTYKLGLSLMFTKLVVMVVCFFAAIVCVGLAVVCLYVCAIASIVIQRWPFRAARRGIRRGLEWNLKVMVRTSSSYSPPRPQLCYRCKQPCGNKYSIATPAQVLARRQLA